jgi:hypothetical protein
MGSWKERAWVVVAALAGGQAFFEVGHQHQRELQALGRVQGHQLHPGLVVAALAGVEDRVRQEQVQVGGVVFVFGAGIGGGLVVELPRRGDQLGEVVGYGPTRTGPPLPLGLPRKAWEPG